MYYRTPNQTVRWTFRPLGLGSLRVELTDADSVQRRHKACAVSRNDPAEQRGVGHSKKAPVETALPVETPVSAKRVHQTPSGGLSDSLTTSWKQKAPPPASASARAGWGSSHLNVFSTQTVRPNIDISYALNGRVKDYAEQQNVTLERAYREITQAGLEAVKHPDGQALIVGPYCCLDPPWGLSARYGQRPHDVWGLQGRSVERIICTRELSMTG